MMTFNIFKAIGDFFTNVVFAPMDALRLGDLTWGAQNAINWFFILIGVILFAYWMKESASFKKKGTEDLA